MAGQVAEFIEEDDITEWIELGQYAYWLNGDTDFKTGTVYSIYNNSSASFKFVVTDDLDEDTFGTFVPQGSVIYYKPDGSGKLYVKGNSFNLAISEIK